MLFVITNLQHRGVHCKGDGYVCVCARACVCDEARSQEEAPSKAEDSFPEELS